MTNMWIWGILITLTALTSYAFVKQIVYKIPVGSHPAPDIILIIALITALVLLILLSVIYLEVSYSQENISIKFYPFLVKIIPRDDISKMEFLKYRPIQDYGGWGIRYGKNTKVYTIHGDHGILITLTNGQKILVGIKNKENYKSLNLNHNGNNQTIKI